MKNNAKSGFTLLELIIVIIIIGVLASIAFVQFGYVIEKARTVEAVVELSIVKNKQLLHKDIYGVYIGNGPISNYPELGYTEPTMEYFENMLAFTGFVGPLGIVVAEIHRKGSPSPYHFHMSENGAISCIINPGGPPKICTKIGFIEVNES